MQNLDFTSLNKAFKGEEWCDSFAYWLLVLHEPQSIYAREAENACAAMSLQYDVEDQAQDKEMLIGSPDLALSVFTLIAPVTLSFKWSPFPSAIEILGQPIHLDTYHGATLAVFAPSAAPKCIGITSDEQHFDFLLQHVSIKAIQSKALILLVGSPGWDYNSEDFINHRPALQSLMRETGFIYTLRKPLNT